MNRIDVKDLSGDLAVASRRQAFAAMAVLNDVASEKTNCEA